MTTAYVNYPNSRISVHGNASCSRIRQARKAGQRVVHVTVETLTQELRTFHTNDYSFGSTQEVNDMWIELDLGDAEYEAATLRFIKKALSVCYKPFEDAEISVHC